MTISRKRTAGAALAGSALVAAAVFTPVAAYAAPADDTQTNENASAVDYNETAAIATTALDYAQAETLEGVGYTGTGFAPNVAFSLQMVLPDGSVLDVDDEDAAQIADADGAISGSVVLNDGTGDVVFPLGTYELIAVQDVDGEEVSNSVAFTVVEELEDNEDAETPVEQTLTVEPTESTLEDSVEGFNFSGTGFAPDAGYTVELQVPGSDEWLPVPDMSEAGDAFVTDADGNLAGTVNYFNQDTGETTEFPAEGDYQLRVTQDVDGEVLMAVSSFTIGATEDDDETPGEEEATQTLGVEQETYTPAETLEGVEYFGEGFAPSTAFQLWVIMPGETEWTEVTDTPTDESNEQVSNGEGQVYGALTYYNLETGDPIEFPEGAYQVRVTQEVDGETLAAEASFTVAEATTEPTETADPTETAAPTEDESSNNGNKGDELAQTGADDMLPVFLAGGLVLMAAGAGLFVVRRRMEA
ncbi:LPXTG cell wall anchor domain-containing protein [Gulosibacter chungangensis]|uniref:LPXTG cell wall anchor domain-containing protein n=1 Tax=Gulosibacter chungangensis TaxID=979746 RepID=A0A7J5BF25_9MICO|nr:LPXTG cell wall anchor domain-containing protein [Gulosibacter chungangensis]KAB1644861.1 LPXTG cell wall anchor domain-containing protein [Gulosibacter chungangensis]